MGSAGAIGGGLMTGGPSGAIGAYQSQQGAKQSADAASRAALAQQGEARANYNETAGIINPASVQALQQMDKSIGEQDKNLQRQETMISQIDPTIIEASQQALRLLRGESSSTLAPVQNQRNLQRQKLVNTLREQMGPGAETSTAGMQALTKFDSETNNLMAGQQQSALSNLGNISSQFSAQRPDMLRNIMGGNDLSQQRFGIAQNQAAALGNARMGLQQTAGAQYAGQLLGGQYQQAAGNQMLAYGVQDQSQNKQMAGSMMAMMSDRDAKTDIKLAKNQIYRDVPTYNFKYKDKKHGAGVRTGVIAQDLLKVNPYHPAVTKGKDGYLRVDYSKVEKK